VVALALAGGRRPRHGVDPGRARGHHRRRHRQPPHQAGERPRPFSTNALVFYLCRFFTGAGIGGVTGPALFGKLVESGKEVNVFYGNLIASVVMIAAGVAEWLLGVDAEGKSLEDIAAPLTAEAAKAEATS
jgi:hypothetical protein